MVQGPIWLPFGFMWVESQPSGNWRYSRSLAGPITRFAKLLGSEMLACR
jgi:hypothetical protein